MKERKKRMKKTRKFFKVVCAECGVESVDYYFFDVSWVMLCICVCVYMLLYTKYIKYIMNKNGPAVAVFILMARDFE